MPRLIAGKTFQMGGVSNKYSLIAHLKNVYKDKFMTWAEDVMQRARFVMQLEQSLVDSIILTPHDFGHTENVGTGRLFDAAFLAAWSKQNTELLPEGYTAVGLMPVGAGPQIFYGQYEEQAEGEELAIATEPIMDSEERRRFFYIEKKDGAQNLVAALIDSIGNYLEPDTKILFQLRKAA